MTKIICAYCGKEVLAEHRNCKYCSSKCRNAARHDPPQKAKPTPHLSVAEVDKLAAAAGMSYGKYVATHREELKE